MAVGAPERVRARERVRALVRVLAPAKINLTLAVLGRRPDGFHELASIVLRVGLADELVVGPRPESDSATRPERSPRGRRAKREATSAEGDRLTVRGDPRCPAEDNLVLRAASLLREGRGGLPGLDLELRKRIPVAAGLGGGSSDAAAALRACAEAWDLRLSPSEQHEHGAGLGSDVPFFAAGVAAALVTGRGERVEPLPAPAGPLGLLLVVGGEKPGTAAVFREHDRQPVPGQARPTTTERLTRRLADSLRTGWNAQELAATAGELRDGNDLWPAAARLVPGLVPLRDAIERSLGRPMLLSGAGPALVALYPARAEAADAARRLAAATLPAPSPTIIATDLKRPTPAWRTP